MEPDMPGGRDRQALFARCRERLSVFSARYYRKIYGLPGLDEPIREFMPEHRSPRSKVVHPWGQTEWFTQ
jgi:hypothetical protein